MSANRLVLATAVASSAICNAQNPAFTPEQMAATEYRVETIGEGLYVLFGIGGNILASVGDQGVLIVDAQFPGMIPKLRATLSELGGESIDFAINTHWHYDHADGNQRLGPEGTWLIAHAASRAKMMQDNVINTVIREPYTQKAYPRDALPVATFDERMSVYFNDRNIELLHVAPAHTTGDAAVLFRDSNVVHLGDVFNNSGYPFIDADNGGDVDGMISFCATVLRELEPGAIVVPGHGPVADYQDLERYIEMLRSVRARIAALIEEGATLQQVVAARPTQEWDAIYGDPTRMIDRVYASLSR